MKFQRDQLLEQLPKHGWQVVEIDESPGNEPWYRCWTDEVWTIESVWSPAGFQTYFFFLVDPQASTKRRKGEEVWAMQIATGYDSLRQFMEGEESDVFPINKGHWNESIKEVFAALAKFRQTALA